MAYKSIPKKFSASTISSFSDCEQALAFQRLIADIPDQPIPVEFIYGTVIHLANERIWNHYTTSKEPLSSNFDKYCFLYLQKVLNGIHGSRGDSEPPENIRWFPPSQITDLNKQQLFDKVESKKKELLGKSYYTFTALRLDAAKLSPFIETKVEFDFTSHNIGISIDNGLEIPLSGRIDLLQFKSNGDYRIIDLKTGSPERSYKRNKAIRDIQMTVYQYAMEKITGRKPIEMFIQPAKCWKELIEKYAENALDKIKIPIEIRHDLIHYQNLANIVSDVYSVINMVINSNKFSPQELNSWTAKSQWGKMAGFAENVRQRRFIPRIGNWCDWCSSIDICREYNHEDWQNYLGKAEEEKKEKIISLPPGDPQGLLFDIKPKPKYIPKKDKLIKKEMLDSGWFLSEKKLFSAIKKIYRSLARPGNQTCPCVKLKLIPLTICKNLHELISGKMAIDDLVADCPYKDCPYKK